jgi:hypothetical protein
MANSSILERFLVHYNSFIASAANQDKGLSLLQWTLWLVSQLHHQQNASRSQALRKLYFNISFCRYILRFYGLPTALEAVLSGSWQDATAKLGKWTGEIMACSMMAYYPLEHMAYLGWEAPGVLPKSLSSPNRWSAWSCRCWLAYLMAELVQSIMRLRRLNQELEADAKQETKDSIRHCQLQVTRTLLFTLPCINWSLPKWDTQPWLPENVCNGLMWLEAVVNVYQAVRKYQVANRKVA